MAVSTENSKITISLTEFQGKSSKVWKYFGFKKENEKIVDSEHYYCLTCYEEQQVLKAFSKTTGTGNMLSHLNSRHKINVHAKNNENSQSKISEFFGSSSQSTNNPESQDLEDPQSQGDYEQKTKRNLKLLKCVINFCCKNLVNVDVIYEGALRDIVSEFVSIRKNSETCKKTIHEVLKQDSDALKKSITDAVSSQNNICLYLFESLFHDYEQFVVLKMAYLDENWMIKDHTLAIALRCYDKLLPVTWLKSSMTSCGLSDKTTKLVSRASFPMRKNIENKPCIGYIIASSLHKGLGGQAIVICDKVVKVLRTIHFMPNKLTTDVYNQISDTVLLVNICKEIKLFLNADIENNLPPWFVQLHILKTFVDAKEQIDDALVLESSYILDFYPGTKEITLIEHLIKIYDCFFQAIQHIYETGEPFVSNKLALKDFLEENLTSLKSDIIDKDKDLANSVETIMEDLKESIVISDTDLLATLLDVRCKGLECTTEHLQNIGKTAKDFIKGYLVVGDEAVLPVATSSTSQPKRKSLFTRRKTNIEVEGNTPDSEIDLFLMEEVEPDAILPWWKQNEQKYKAISVLAKEYIPVLISALPKEFYDINFIKKLHKIALLNSDAKEMMAFIHLNKF